MVGVLAVVMFCEAVVVLESATMTSFNLLYAWEVVSGVDGSTEGVYEGSISTDTSLTVFSTVCEAGEVPVEVGAVTSDVLALGGELGVTVGMSVTTAGGEWEAPDCHCDASS